MATLEDLDCRLGRIEEALRQGFGLGELGQPTVALTGIAGLAAGTVRASSRPFVLRPPFNGVVVQVDFAVNPAQLPAATFRVAVEEGPTPAGPWVPAEDPLLTREQPGPKWAVSTTFSGFVAQRYFRVTVVATNSVDGEVIRTVTVTPAAVSFGRPTLELFVAYDANSPGGNLVAVRSAMANTLGFTAARSWAVPSNNNATVTELAFDGLLPKMVWDLAGPPGRVLLPAWSAAAVSVLNGTDRPVSGVRLFDPQVGGVSYGTQASVPPNGRQWVVFPGAQGLVLSDFRVRAYFPAAPTAGYVTVGVTLWSAPPSRLSNIYPLWQNAAVGAGGASYAVLCEGFAQYMLFGVNAGTAATTLTVQSSPTEDPSQDFPTPVGWYDNDYFQVGAGQSFAFAAPFSGRYLRVTSSAATTLTVYLQVAM